MKYSVWKWMFGISLTILILLIVFTFIIWALINATGAFATTVMGGLDIPHLHFDEFLVDSVGSPMFYAYVIDLAMLLPSLIMLIINKKQ